MSIRSGRAAWWLLLLPVIGLAGCGSTQRASDPGAAASSTTAGRSPRSTGAPLASCAWVRSYPIVKLRLDNRAPIPTVKAHLYQRVDVITPPGRGAEQLAVPRSSGQVCYFDVQKARSGAITATYVMQAAGTMRFYSSFVQPTALSDPYDSGIVHVSS